MKIINKIKQIVICMFIVTMVTSCDDTAPEIGGASQNYNNALGLIKQNKDLTLYYEAIQLSGLTSVLDTNEDFTYFVPNDASISAYLVANGFINELGYSDIKLVPVEQLKVIVLSHVIKGVKKRVAVLDGVNDDYLESGEYATMQNAIDSDLYLLNIDVNDGVLKVNGSSNAAVATDIYAKNGFVHVINNIINLSPPTPVITSVSQAFASSGDIITIFGKNFVKVKSVKFDNTEAVVVGTPTKTEIKVTVPANFVSYGLITIQTEFGLSQPATIGVKYLLYGDNFNGQPKPANDGGWGGAYDFQNTEKVSRGIFSIKKISEAWSGFSIGFADKLKVADYNYLKISVFPTETTKILVSLNSDNTDENGVTVVLKAGEWNNISIPFSTLKTDKIGLTFNSLFIKEYSGIQLTPSNTIYLDDIGFL